MVTFRPQCCLILRCLCGSCVQGCAKPFFFPMYAKHCVPIIIAGVSGHDSAGGPPLLPLLRGPQPAGRQGLGLHKAGT